MGREKELNRRPRKEDTTAVSDFSESRDLGKGRETKKRKRKIKDLPPPEPSYSDEESEISEFSEEIAPSEDDYAGRIIGFYKKYDPDKVKNVP